MLSKILSWFEILKIFLLIWAKNKLYLTFILSQKLGQNKHKKVDIIILYNVFIF